VGTEAMNAEAMDRLIPATSLMSSGVADEHGLSPLGDLEEVRERDPVGRIVVHHRTIDTLGRILRSLHIFRTAKRSE
jgi:hypothetical protein